MQQRRPHGIQAGAPGQGFAPGAAPKAGPLPGLAGFGRMQGMGAPTAPAQRPAQQYAPQFTPTPMRQAPMPPPEPEELTLGEDMSFYDEGDAQSAALDFSAPGNGQNANYEQQAYQSLLPEDLQAMLAGTHSGNGYATDYSGTADPHPGYGDTQAGHELQADVQNSASFFGAPQDDAAHDYQPDYGANAQQPNQWTQPQQAQQPRRQPVYPNAQQQPVVAGYDRSRGLQPFEARYDQHPEIPIGLYPQANEDPLEQPFYPAGEGDAGFDQPFEGMEGEQAPRKSRRTWMIGGALASALAVGGSLAYAYKSGGNDVASLVQPPLIQADGRPVKSPPTEPGGKQFPNKNKLIYDRLQGDDRPEQERLVPRQEEVNRITPGGQTQPPGVVAHNPPTTAPGGTDADTVGGTPRRVRTFVVRPDGSVVQPETETTATTTPAPRTTQPIPGMAVMMPERPAGDQGTQTRPQPTQQPVTQPAQQPAPKQQPVLARTTEPEQTPPAPRKQPPAAPTKETTGGNVVVQVASHKSQTEALAAFADMQQRYPQLLSGYRPLIERADLGDKGVWYRLRVGPMNTKQVADVLCQKLASAGHKDCKVHAQ